MTKADLLPQILQLPPAERWELLDDIRQSLQEPVSITVKQRAELDRRLAEIDSKPDAGDTLENVVSRLRARA